MFERYHLIRPKNKKIWDALTPSGEVAFVKTFYDKEEKICLGDFFKLRKISNDIVFYFQYKNEEPICLHIPNLYWKKLLDFEYATRMYTESQLISNEFHDPERWNNFCQTYSTFWKHQYPYFKLECVSNPRTRCLLFVCFSDLTYLIQALQKLTPKKSKQV